ncbi:MAG TPA: hypothetical protein VNV85_03460, partial [Puia sp.]|nr:hypothetical protein [Puia sp.]
MNRSENEYLDDKKKRLEVEKLEFDVRNKQYFPPRLLIYLQPLLPSVFTLASIVGTLIILSKTKFFENANTLYEIKNQNLKAEGEKLEKLKLGLDSSIFILRDSISKLSSSINVYKSVLGKTKNSMTTCQQEIAKLTIDLNRANETNKANESNITRLTTELNMARITKIDPSLAGG